VRGSGFARRPILVTGVHRSGTTWVGDVLGLSSEVHYVHEPFAPMYERSWLREPPRERYYHEAPDAVGRYEADLARIAALQPPWLAIARRAGGPRNALRLAQEYVAASAARRRGARALVKDPFALLSAEWIAARSEADVIVLVRHPAAFASSVKRLGWRLDVRWLLEQPRLLSGELADFEAELRREVDAPSDLVGHACLVWRVLNSVVARYVAQYPEWQVLRYEDLAADPTGTFPSVFQRAGLAWTPAIQRSLPTLTSSTTVADVRPDDPGSTRRDSQQAMWTWTTRLSRDEIERVRLATWDVASNWYDGGHWTPPGQ
jgi:hypothetical protein